MRSALTFITVSAVLGLVTGCGGSTQTGKSDKTRRAPSRVDPWRAAVADRHAPVPSPTSKKERVVFLRAGSVWIMGPTGGEPTAISVRSHEAADEAPAFSPDGKRIAYASNKDGKKTIQVVALADMVPKRISDGAAGGDTEPTWSPDGKRIVFVRGHAEDRHDLFVVPADGSRAPELLLRGDDDKPVYAGTPAWSPDGKTIVFSSDRREGKGTGLWLLDVATKRLRRLTFPRPGAWFVRDRYATWSPDGKHIAFASNRHVASGDQADDYDIYAINPDGSGLIRLTDDPGAAFDPAYSPDGKRIVFTSTRDRKNEYELELYVMAAQGGKQQRMTRDDRPQNSAPSMGIAK